MARETLRLTHNMEVSIQDVLRVGEGGVAVELADETAALLDERRAQIVAFVNDTHEPAYGFNRGFGHNVKLEVGPEGTEALQVNLIRSHASGVGPAAPREIVRCAMFLRACSLARGHSGVRAVVVQRLLDCLNADITPVVPRLGSVSASGDLAPLSHIALGIMGEGEVFVRDEREPKSAAVALADAGIPPLRLEMKEGLALNNGVQYTTAIGAYCLGRLEVLLKNACLATALTTQVILGADTPFRADLHELRPHPGAKRVARWIFDLMAGSPIREAHRPYEVDGEIQDPYNIRCAAQVLGACAEILSRASQTLTVEMNSVTDNPLLLKATPEHGWDRRYDGKYLGQYVEITSGGHFHGMPVAVEMYGLLQAMAMMARLSNMRCVRYVDEDRNKGLGSDLKWPGPTDDNQVMQVQATLSGMMIPEYVSAALTNWIWGLCMPSHLFSLSTDAGQEDHVSMAANVALRVLDALPRLAETLAIEIAFAAQAAAIRKEMDHIPSRAHCGHCGTTKKRYPWKPHERMLNEVGEEVLRKVAESFPTVTKDRPFSNELQALATRVLDGTLIQVAEGRGCFRRDETEDRPRH